MITCASCIEYTHSVSGGRQRQLRTVRHRLAGLVVRRRGRRPRRRTARPSGTRPRSRVGDGQVQRHRLRRARNATDAGDLDLDASGRRATGLPPVPACNSGRDRSRVSVNRNGVDGVNCLPAPAFR